MIPKIRNAIQTNANLYALKWSDSIVLGSPRKFADLLTEGISLLKSRERKTIRMIQEELGEALGLSYHTIEHWRKGKQLPAQANYVEQLAREFIKRGKFDQAWVVQFFASAGYKNGAGQFGDQLFSQPTPGVAPQLKETLKPTLSIVKPFRSLIGRDNDVKKLSDALIDPNAKRMIGIDGVGGIGKSALAHELIDLCQQRGGIGAIDAVAILGNALPSFWIAMITIWIE